MWLLQQLVPASVSANRCHHRLTDRVAHATCGRLALTALHSTPHNAEGKLFGIAIFDLISKWPLRLISPALLLLLCPAPPSTPTLLLFVPGQHLPSTNATCCGGRLQVARANRSWKGKWLEVEGGRQTWHTQQVFRFMYLRLDCSQNTNATNAARRSCCCCSCCSCSRRFTLGVFIQNV